jgi:hypothetical protein
VRQRILAISYTIDDLDSVSNAYQGVEFGYVEVLLRPQADRGPLDRDPCAKPAQRSRR